MATIEKKEFYTTGEASRLLFCTSQSVINYCDRGWLRCQRVMGQGPRKIYHESLVAFMIENDIDIPEDWSE